MANALTLQNVSKSFAGVPALVDVSLSVGRGEIFALVGENGAGKTTLMNVVYGLYQPDAGRVRVFDVDAPIDSPRAAIAHGVGMVHQHFMLVPNLTVAENVVLGREPRRFGLLDRRRAEAEVGEVASRYGFALDPAARVEQISVGMQQRVEIVKALYRGAELLILDEPTAVLTPQEADELYAIVRRLASAGKTVVFISHKLREVLSVAERVGVMRRGRLVETVRAADTDAARLSAAMVGHEVTAMTRRPRTGARAADGAPLLVVDGLCARDDRGHPALTDVGFTLHAGEILAVAGVDGNGQAELAEVLTGLRRPERGSVLVAGRQLAGASPRDFRDAKVGHVPADRQKRGLCLNLQVAENLALGRQQSPPFARGPLIDAEARAREAERLVQAFDVRPADPSMPARALSGGNQQKVILARELDAGPSVLVVVQPTRGLDVGAIARVHERLRAERDAGRAVLLVSLDLDEVLALADRVLVLYGGRVMGVVDGETASPESLGTLMLGQRSAA
ncbi:MAG: ABC transporter ATP-binding protein [Myxococcales bacterium]